MAAVTSSRPVTPVREVGCSQIPSSRSPRVKHLPEVLGIIAFAGLTTMVLYKEMGSRKVRIAGSFISTAIIAKLAGNIFPQQKDSVLRAIGLKSETPCEMRDRIAGTAKKDDTHSCARALMTLIDTRFIRDSSSWFGFKGRCMTDGEEESLTSEQRLTRKKAETAPLDAFSDCFMEVHGKLPGDMQTEFHQHMQSKAQGKSSFGIEEVPLRAYGLKNHVLTTEQEQGTIDARNEAKGTREEIRAFFMRASPEFLLEQIATRIQPKALEQKVLAAYMFVSRLILPKETESLHSAIEKMKTGTAFHSSPKARKSLTLIEKGLSVAGLNVNAAIEKAEILENLAAKLDDRDILRLYLEASKDKSSHVYNSILNLLQKAYKKEQCDRLCAEEKRYLTSMGSSTTSAQRSRGAAVTALFSYIFSSPSAKEKDFNASIFKDPTKNEAFFEVFLEESLKRLEKLNCTNLEEANRKEAAAIGAAPAAEAPAAAEAASTEIFEKVDAAATTPLDRRLRRSVSPLPKNEFSEG